MGSCCSLAAKAEKEGRTPEKGFGAWLERACSRLETWPFLVVGGLCLLASFLLTGHGCRADGASHAGWLDPAFVTAFICGVPILREAAESLFAERKKAPVQRIADRWAAILVPSALAFAALTCLGVWAWCGDLATGLVRGVTVLVVFCPCALALATPTAIMAAIGHNAGSVLVVLNAALLYDRKFNRRNRKERP